MKIINRLKHLNTVIIATLFLVSPISAFADNWEYQVKTYLLTGNTQYLTAEMNKLGAIGWELVSCVSIEDDGKILCTYKRIKSK